MPITFLDSNKDLFKSDAQTIVNAVNCFGVMGKGIALEFKLRYPEMYKEYHEKCRKGYVRLGEPYLWKGPEKWVLNFPTKHHYSEKSSLDYITSGLGHFRVHYEEWGVSSIAFPALGCGLGDLSWKEVRTAMVHAFSNIDISVEIYEPR